MTTNVTELRLREQLMGEADPSTGSLGSTITGGLWLQPRLVTPVGEHLLVAHWVDSPEIERAKPGMLESFLRLGDAEPSKIATFASAYGRLRSRPIDDVDLRNRNDELGDAIRRVEQEEAQTLFWSVEHAEDWRFEAGYLGVLLDCRAAATEQSPEAIGHRIAEFFDECSSRREADSAAASYLLGSSYLGSHLDDWRPGRRRIDRIVESDGDWVWDLEAIDGLLAIHLQEVLAAWPIRLAVSDYGGFVPTLRPSSAIAAVAQQTMGLINGGKAPAVCSGPDCGRIYFPDRAPARSRARFCAECTELGVPDAVRSKRYRERNR